MTKKQPAKFYWEGENIERQVLTLRLKSLRNHAMAVYAFGVSTNGDTNKSYEFYLQLREQIDTVQVEI